MNYFFGESPFGRQRSLAFARFTGVEVGEIQKDVGGSLRNSFSMDQAKDLLPNKQSQAVLAVFTQ